jgi:hypothetical protein
VSKYPCSVSRVFASIVQCLERHSTPVFTGWWVLGVCGCFVDRFVGGFGGGVTPGPFPNPVAKPTCADGTAPGRVWESRSPPALNVVRGGPVPHPGRHTVCRSGWGRGLLLLLCARVPVVAGVPRPAGVRAFCRVPGPVWSVKSSRNTGHRVWWGDPCSRSRTIHAAVRVCVGRVARRGESTLPTHTRRPGPGRHRRRWVLRELEQEARPRGEVGCLVLEFTDDGAVAGLCALECRRRRGGG